MRLSKKVVPEVVKAPIIDFLELQSERHIMNTTIGVVSKPLSLLV